MRISIKLDILKFNSAYIYCLSLCFRLIILSVPRPLLKNFTLHNQLSLKLLCSSFKFHSFSLSSIPPFLSFPYPNIQYSLCLLFLLSLHPSIHLSIHSSFPLSLFAFLPFHFLLHLFPNQFICPFDSLAPIFSPSVFSFQSSWTPLLPSALPASYSFIRIILFCFCLSLTVSFSLLYTVCSQETLNVIP